MLKPGTRSLGDELQQNRGTGPGFDFLRVFLSLAVVGFHAAYLVGYPQAMHRVSWFTAYWVLAVFFSLSGFLITGSALRLRLRDFLLHRGFRIVPALLVAVVLSAFVLGPVFTGLPLRAYFCEREFYSYLMNIFGWVHFDLPGVFDDHRVHGVNVSLWTIPFEAGCYAIISALVYFRLLEKPKLILAMAVWVVALGLLGSRLADSGMGAFAECSLDAVFCGRGSRLFVSFLLGVAAYLYKDRIPYDFRIFVGCVVYCVGISLLSPRWWDGEISFPVLNFVAAAPLTYVMVYIGVSKMPRVPFFHRGDYSYGIYLYGFPLQQVVEGFVPGRNVAVHFVAALLLIVPFAMLSWHFIEKPILQLRKRFCLSLPREFSGTDCQRDAFQETGWADNSLQQP